jgi:hypothetical protein
MQLTNASSPKNKLLYEDVNNKCRLSYPDSWLEERPCLLLLLTMEEYLVTLCTVRVFKLRSCYLRLILGHAL